MRIRICQAIRCVNWLVFILAFLLPLAMLIVPSVIGRFGEATHESLESDEQAAA